MHFVHTFSWSSVSCTTHLILNLQLSELETIETIVLCVGTSLHATTNVVSGIFGYSWNCSKENFFMSNFPPHSTAHKCLLSSLPPLPPSSLSPSLPTLPFFLLSLHPPPPPQETARIRQIGPLHTNTELHAR